MEQIFIIHHDGTKTPLSKGILSQQIAAVGGGLELAYDIAQKIQTSLRKKKHFHVDGLELNAMIGQVLTENVSSQTALRWQRWGEFRASDIPVIMLITGGNGTGKSTLASQLCLRLGITRLTSTDSIREVMRELSVKSLVPQLYQSSYNVTPPPGARLDDPIAGFTHQAHAVNIGIQAIIKRASHEKISMILEGVHLLPSVSSNTKVPGCAVIPITLTVPDPVEHHSRFVSREADTDGQRPLGQYMEHFKSIRAIHDYLINEALSCGHMIVNTAQMELAVPDLIDKIINQADEIKTLKNEQKQQLGK